VPHGTIVHYNGRASLLQTTGARHGIRLDPCAPDASAVNIDEGFGAVCIASQINHL